MRTSLAAPAALLVVAMAAGGCARTSGAGPPATSAAAATTSTVAQPGSSTAPAVSGWPVFTSAAGGFRLRHPPGWRAKESSGSGGPVLSLLPPRGSGISVLVTSTAPPDGGAPSAPDVSCRPVTVGGLVGRRCLDTTAMVVTTALQGRERWYVLTASLRRPAVAAGTYDRVVGSFQPV